MAEEKNLPELILRWQELREQGQSVTPEGLCADCPELLTPLKKRLDALAAMEGFLGLGPSAAGSCGTPEPLSVTTDHSLRLSEIGRAHV